jgi:hypothetical protein
MGYVSGVLVLITLVVMYNNSTHTIPQTTTSFTVQKVYDLSHFRSMDDQVFESKAAFELSTFHTESHLPAVSAVKYSLGCYGSAEPVRSAATFDAATS